MARNLDPSPIYALVPIYCIKCGRRGKGYANIMTPQRKSDKRHCGCCSLCATASVHWFNATAQPTLFDGPEFEDCNPEDKSYGAKGNEP